MGTRLFLRLPLFTSMAIAAVVRAQSPSLSIQVDHLTATVNPMFYGLMTEEINFSYDGGLYAELIRDRAIGPGRRPLFYWTHVARGESVVDVDLDDHAGPSAALPRSIKVTVSAASEGSPAGLQNEGFWGIAVRPNTTYKGSFYAKADVEGVPITASLVNDETGAVAASATITGVTREWKQYTYTIKPAQVPVTANNHFMLTVTKLGTFWFNLGFLFSPTYL